MSKRVKLSDLKKSIDRHERLYQEAKTPEQQKFIWSILVELRDRLKAFAKPNKDEKIVHS